MSDEVATHVVPVPRFFFFLRIAQAVLTLVVLVLAIYGLTYSTWFPGGNDFATFVSVASFIILGYYFLSTLRFPVAYNRWAVLALECFANVCWLACWTDLATWAAAYSSWYVVDDAHYFNTRAKSYRDAMAAAAGIGALNWVLFTVTLVVFGIGLHRHRKSAVPDGAAQNGTTAETVQPAGKEPLQTQAPPEAPLEYPMYDQPIH